MALDSKQGRARIFLRCADTTFSEVVLSQVVFLLREQPRCHQSGIRTEDFGDEKAQFLRLRPDCGPDMRSRGADGEAGGLEKRCSERCTLRCDAAGRCASRSSSPATGRAAPGCGGAAASDP